MVKKRFRLNLTRKFVVMLLVISILPMLAVSIVSTRIARNIIRNEAAQYTAELIDAQNTYLELQLREVESVIANISGVDEIQAALVEDTPPNDDYTSLATQARIGYILNGYVNLDGLVSIDIFTLKGAHYHVGDTLDISNIRQDVVDSIYQKVSQSGNRIVWTGIEENVNARSSYKKVLTAGSVLTALDADTLQQKPVALLLANYSLEAIYNHLSGVDLGDSAYMMVVDAYNRIIYHPNRNLIGGKVSPEFIGRLSGGRGQMDDLVDGQEMLISYNHLFAGDWVVVSLVPISTLMDNTNTIETTTFLTLGFSLVVIVIFGFLISRQVVNPLSQIVQRFQSYQQGASGWDKSLAVNNQQDEVGELVTWFNAFVESLKSNQQMAQALQESEERYSLAVRGANDGIWDWNLQDGRVYYSPRWKDILDLDQDSPHIGLTHPLDLWLNRIHPEDLSRFKEDLNQHLSGQKPYLENEHRLRSKDGVSYRWVQARGLALRNHDCQPYRIAGSITDITTRKEIEQRLRHDALHDILTGLPNRAYFLEQIQHLMNKTRRSQATQAAVLFFDIDRFKIVNDSLGHTTGDRMLVAISQRLQGCLRASDILARFGGDEFAILLDPIDFIQDATRVALRIQKELATPFIVDGRELFTSASIGIAFIGPAYERVEDIIRDADAAMYRAKAKGRNRFEIFDANMHAQSLHVLQLEADLRRATERNEFEILYQPILALSTDRIEAVEALVRWNHPVHGQISPGEFIPLAEETGLIVEMDQLTMRNACQQLKAWDRAGCAELIMSVNVSSRQLQDKRFPEIVGNILAEVGLPPERLQVEITEHAAMEDLDQTVRMLEELSAMRVKIAIDDFGTSYSSLGYLKRFPLDCLKIDRTFIQGITTDKDLAAITTAIIAMAHILDLEVVAEGVETAEQKKFLSDHGCDKAQGFLYSQAVVDQKLLDLMQQQTL